jgi:uncharacterized protein HemY
MPSAREAKFLQMVQQYPESPLGHFSLGKFYLEESRWQEAVAALELAVQKDPTYAAAWVALGDAYAGSGAALRAQEVFQRALQTPHAQKDTSLQADIAQRLSRLS